MNATKRLNLSKHFSSKEYNPCVQCAVGFILVFPMSQIVLSLILVQPRSLCLRRVHEILTAVCSPVDQAFHFLVSQPFA